MNPASHKGIEIYKLLLISVCSWNCSSEKTFDIPYGIKFRFACEMKDTFICKASYQWIMLICAIWCDIFQSSTPLVQLVVTLFIIIAMYGWPVRSIVSYWFIHMVIWCQYTCHEISHFVLVSCITFCYKKCRTIIPMFSIPYCTFNMLFFEVESDESMDEMIVCFNMW